MGRTLPSYFTHSIQDPAIGDALQLMLTDALEGQPAAGGEILDRLRHRDLAGARQRADPSADRDADPAHLAVDHLALPGVDAGSNLYPQATDGFDDVLGATDGAPRPVECGEEPVKLGFRVAHLGDERVASRFRSG